jgi:hypothetical protein
MDSIEVADHELADGRRDRQPIPPRDPDRAPAVVGLGGTMARLECFRSQIVAARFASAS